MKLSKPREIKEIPVPVSSTLWLLWVDDEIWGYTSTLDEAEKSRDDLSQEIKKVIQKEHPQWFIECLNIEDKVKVKCLHPGWVYNSKWTAHTIRYESVCKFNLQEPIDLTPYMRSPIFAAIQKQEEAVQPTTRPPTPCPEEQTPTTHPPLVLEEVPVPPSLLPMPENRRNSLKKNRKKSKSN